MWSLKRAKQCLCVNFENYLQMYLRLWLKPCLLDPNEIYRICGLDVKVNLVFNKLYNHMNHLSRKGLYKVWENLLLTLYIKFFKELTFLGFVRYFSAKIEQSSKTSKTELKNACFGHFFKVCSILAEK